MQPESLPAPLDSSGNSCPGPFERTVSSCRPGETDVSVYCQVSHARRHFVLDAAGSVIHDSAEPERSQLTQYRAGLTVSPGDEGARAREGEGASAREGEGANAREGEGANA